MNVEEVIKNSTVVNIEESVYRPFRNDKPLKLYVQFRGMEGVRNFGQKVENFCRIIKSQFDSQTIREAPMAVLCIKKTSLNTFCELIYQPPISLNTEEFDYHF